MTEVESGKMSPETLTEFLLQPNIARLATAERDTSQPHVVPVWYLWDGESVWISSFRSTRKVKELQENPLCSIVVDTADSGVDYRSVVFEGEAELISDPLDFVQELTTRIYIRYLGETGVLEPDPQSWIHSPENLLIKLTPERTYTWYSAAKKE